MNKEVEQTILTATQKWAAETFPKLSAFAHEQLGVAAVHVARAAERVAAYVEEMEQAKGQAFRRLSETEERLRQIEERYQQLATVHANQIQECERLRTSLSRARHTNALLQEKLGDWTDEPCPGCLGAGKPSCKSLCAHPERDVCPCACHKPCQDCGGTGHKWVSWEEQFKQLRSFALQSAIGDKFKFRVESSATSNPEPLEDVAPGGSSHYVGCPRRTDEHQSCRCALVGQQKF